MSLTCRHKVSPLTSAVQCDPHYSQSSHPLRRPAEGPSPPDPAVCLPETRPHPPQWRGTQTLFSPKVLWTVISKTIPWMTALIENNEGHIEHMVAVVSPCLLSPPKKELQSKLCQTEKREKSARLQRTFAINFTMAFNE